MSPVWPASRPSRRHRHDREEHLLASHAIQAPKRTNISRNSTIAEQQNRGRMHRRPISARSTLIRPSSSSSSFQSRGNLVVIRVIPTKFRSIDSIDQNVLCVVFQTGCKFPACCESRYSRPNRMHRRIWYGMKIRVQSVNTAVLF